MGCTTSSQTTEFQVVKFLTRVGVCEGFNRVLIGSVRTGMLLLQCVPSFGTHELAHGSRDES